MGSDDCVNFVPFEHYNWTFNRVGWLQWNPTAICLIAAFCAIGYWMCIELLVLVYVTFKRHSGIYFWSIIVTTIGIILQTTGYILFNFKNSCPVTLVILICKVGWVSNVSGFSIVLWSRLHLVVNNPRTLKIVLIMILVNGFLCHTPIVVFEFGLRTANRNAYYHPMQIMERIQQTIFTLQECVISGLYIYHTKRFLNIGYPMHTRKVIGLLLCVQVLVVALDATLTAFDYSDMFTLKCTVHPFVYSVKLKLEFIVLNQLQTLVKRGLTPGLGLRSTLTSISDSRGSEPSAPGAPRFVAPIATVGTGFDRGFITKAGAAIADDHSRVQSMSDASIDSNEKNNAANGSPSSSEVEDEYDLKNVMGKPDDVIVKETRAADDIERRYLGRWSDGESRS